MDFALEQQNPTGGVLKIAFVIVLHILIVYALVNGLALKIVHVVKDPLQVTMILDRKPPPPAELLRPPPPSPIPLAPFIPPPEINIAEPPPAPAITVTPRNTPSPAALSGSSRTAPVIDATHDCALPQYPAASLRLGESGSVILKFLIDVTGHVIQGKVQRSSGYERLDQTALQTLSRCRFKPGTVDGVPEESWNDMKWNWTLPR